MTTTEQEIKTQTAAFYTECHDLIKDYQNGMITMNELANGIKRVNLEIKSREEDLTQLARLELKYAPVDATIR